MGLAYECDICKVVLKGHRAMRIQADILQEGLDEKPQTKHLDVCPSCANKVLKVFNGDFGYVPPKYRDDKKGE